MAVAGVVVLSGPPLSVDLKVLVVVGRTDEVLMMGVTGVGVVCCCSSPPVDAELSAGWLGVLVIMNSNPPAWPPSVFAIICCCCPLSRAISISRIVGTASFSLCSISITLSIMMNFGLSILAKLLVTLVAGSGVVCRCRSLPGELDIDVLEEPFELVPVACCIVVDGSGVVLVELSI